MPGPGVFRKGEKSLVTPNFPGEDGFGRPFFVPCYSRSWLREFVNPAHIKLKRLDLSLYANGISVYNTAALRRIG
jgi:hypothetical protein